VIWAGVHDAWAVCGSLTSGATNENDRLFCIIETSTEDIAFILIRVMYLSDGTDDLALGLVFLQQSVSILYLLPRQDLLHKELETTVLESR
jgi:hypothetical protein